MQQRLKQLLSDSYWSRSDKEWLLDYMENTDARELEALMLQWHKEDLQTDNKIKAQLSTLMWQHIAAHTGVNAGTNTPRQAIIHRVHSLRKWGWAAAVLLLIGTGAYLYTTSKKTKSDLVNSQSTNNILPGGNKAMLTLADGRVIILDSAANGQLANQGGTQIVKLANGEIRYDLKGISSDEVMMNTMRTPRGGQYQVVLPDGSRVWLNAASSITYPAVFIGKERKVKITGEAYLEVARNKQHPFIVDVDGKSVVEVLGTSFNVNSYADEAAIKTTLLDGSVKVIVNNTSKVLKPGQQAVQVVEKQDIKIHLANLDQTLAWKNGMFNFNGMPLSSVMKQLERWYDIKVQYEGKQQNIIFEGKMFRNLVLADVLYLLREMDVKFRLEGRTLIIQGT